MKIKINNNLYRKMGDYLKKIEIAINLGCKEKTVNSFLLGEIKKLSPVRYNEVKDKKDVNLKDELIKLKI